MGPLGATEKTTSNDVDKCLGHDILAHLAAAHCAVREDDRNLFDAETLAIDLHHGLDLECVALEADEIEVERLQDVAAIALEAGRTVADR